MHRKLFLYLFLTVATLAVFWQVHDHEFINFDDPQYITENRHVQGGLSPDGVVWAFTTAHASNWHPLTWLSHMLDVELYGLNPRGHHLTNVFLHLLNTLLLFFILQRMTGALWRSGFVAALFALHPLHVESVAWVAERKDVLSTLFWLLTLWAYTWYVEGPKFTRYLLALFSFALGLMAKPMLVTLPFVLLLLDYWPLGRIQAGQVEGADRAETPTSIPSNKQMLQTLRLVWEKVPFFLLAAASSIVTFLVQQRGGALTSLEVFPFKVRLANALVSYARYMGKMFWPQKLAVLYPHPGYTLPIWQIAGAGLLLFLISFLVIRAGRRYPYLAVGWLWFLGTMVPVIGLVQVGAQAMADRYTYIPLIGLCIIISWGVAELVAGWRYRRVVLAVATGAAILALTICTFIQLRHWRSATALFEHAIEVTSDNYVAHNNLGNKLAAQGNIDEAIAHYSEALRINPAHAKAYYNLGIALAKQGKYEVAIAHYSKALQLKPDYVDAHNNLGLTLMEQGKFHEAIAHYTRAIHIDPKYEIAHNNLGVALDEQGNHTEALAHYSRAIELNPQYAEAHNNMGALLADQGKLDEALAHYFRAIQLNPEYAEAHNNLGVALKEQERFNEAVAHYSKALRIKPNYAQAHYNLGGLLADQGKLDEAIAHYYEALRIKPDYANARVQLAMAFMQKGQTDKAIHQYRTALHFRPDWPEVLNNLAWILATHEDPEFRDGVQALQLAQKACELTHHKEANFLDTLAAAYAETDQFDQALHTAQIARQMALAAGQVEMARVMEKRMQLFKAGKRTYESSADTRL